MRPPLGNKKALRDWTIRVLRNLGLKPRKALGQNFVIDPWVVNVVAKNVMSCKEVVEVGGGLGVLTARLSDFVEHVVSVEIDTKLLEVLGEVAREHHNIDVVHADILDWEVGRVECLAGNIPFSITGPLFESIVKKFQPKRACLTVQNEVGLRLAAKPGSRSYGRLTILVKLLYDVSLGPLISSRAFYPEPEVDARVVVLTRNDRRVDLKVIEAVEKLTSCLFAERNKRARKVVKRCCGVDIDFGDRRVYELSVEEMLKLVTEFGCYL